MRAVSAHAFKLRIPAISPVVGIGVGVVAVSTASIFIRFAQQAGIHSLVIAALRLTLASAVLLPFAIARSRDEYRALSARHFGIALLSGAFLGAHFATWILSLAYTSVVSSVVLVTLSPLFVAVGSALVLRERLNAPVLIGMAVAIAGGVLIGVGDSAQSQMGRDPLLGNALALTGALCVAPYFIIGRALRERLSLLAYVTLVYGVAAVTLLLVWWISGVSLEASALSGLVWVALLALLPQLVGHTSFNWSLRRLPAVYATVPVLGEPVGSSVLAVIFLGETITLPVLVGAVLVLIGIGTMSVGRASA